MKRIRKFIRNGRSETFTYRKTLPTKSKAKNFAQDGGYHCYRIVKSKDRYAVFARGTRSNN